MIKIVSRGFDGQKYFRFLWQVIPNFKLKPKDVLICGNLSFHKINNVMIFLLKMVWKEIFDHISPTLSQLNIFLQQLQHATEKFGNTEKI